MKTFYLVANSVQGVMKFDCLEDYLDDIDEIKKAELMTPKDFYNSLKYCGTNNIFCAIDGDSIEIYEKIQSEYGIR